MNRREAILALVALAAMPRAAEAQPAKIPRIGYLSAGSVTASARNAEAFRQGLRDFGWVERQNIVVEYRYAEGRVERLPDLAAELVRSKVDVIVAVPTAAALAAKNATATIPIVMANAAQPVELGLVASLARPGGNVTGLSWSVDLEIVAKGIELLHEALPKARRVAVLANPANPTHMLAIERVRSAARSSGIQLQILEVRGPGDFDDAFAQMTKQRAQALLVVADFMVLLHRQQLVELIARNRLPSMHGIREEVEAGGLMSYGPDLLANNRRAAYFVDKILKGAKPATLPVEQPTTYELVINLKAARALGLRLPQSLVVRANQVIE